MQNTLFAILSAIIGYALGCFSTGLIVSKAFGKIDIREYGSGNAGMTNVLRTLGWLPSALTFLGDALKGVLASLIGRALAGDIGMLLGGLFSVIGHNWPAIFRFKGGKGISTSFGFIIVFDWRIALILVPVQLIVLLTTGYMSLASITSAIGFFVLTLVFQKPWMYLLFSGIATLMALFSHRANIKRLLTHTENKLDIKKISQKSKQTNEEIKNRKKGAK